MITVKRTFDLAEIRAFAVDPVIHEKSSHDYSPTLAQLEAMPDAIFAKCLDSAVYIGGYVDGEIASLFAVDKGNTLHFMVLKPFKRLAHELVEASLKIWPEPVKVRVPITYRSLINFAKKHRFKETGVETGRFFKHGKFVDRLILENGE